MPLQSSGQISLAQIAAEFGGSAPHALSEYYGDGNAPGSGEIRLGADFHGTSSGPAFVASVTSTTSNNMNYLSFNLSGQVQNNDIVIVTWASYAYCEQPGSSNGISMTTLTTGAASGPGYYTGYGTWTTGTSTTLSFNSAKSWNNGGDIAGIASIFRPSSGTMSFRAGSQGNYSYVSTPSGAPAASHASTQLSIRTISAVSTASLSAPSGYTLAGQISKSNAGDPVYAAIAYSVNPGTSVSVANFSGMTDDNIASTLLFG
tara:strand:+ start:2642 stop:3421 length:780 start_codon:yes stop_codon:yes gene_type:complete